MSLQGDGGHKTQYAGCLVLVPVSEGFFAVVLHFCRLVVSLFVSFCMAVGEPNATESESVAMAEWGNQSPWLKVWYPEVLATLCSATTIVFQKATCL